ncbi:MAG TPA: hypothetical protein VHU92_07180 [Streptosporangiaceae bacterium]|jgi:hypothetical protein|nr:hypothetical protein [Streptosporangiaceae bacterium]
MTDTKIWPETRTDAPRPPAPTADDRRTSGRLSGRLSARLFALLHAPALLSGPTDDYSSYSSSTRI